MTLTKIIGRLNKKLKILAVFIFIFIFGLLSPTQHTIPVKNASANDWNHETFWYYPWGSSIVHKGIDIFAEIGRPVIASNSGLVLFAGELSKGGKVALVLTGKWQLNYYAHLDTLSISTMSYVSVGDEIGKVGTSGNAVGKEPHLHYTILSLVPHPWRFSTSDTLGYMKMFYLNPDSLLR